MIDRCRSKTFISGLSYEVGEPQRIDSLRNCVDNDLLDMFRKQGLRDFCASGDSASSLAARSLSKTIACSNRSCGDIDLLLICSETLDPREKGGMELLSYMEAAGLEAVPTVALSMNSCGNLMPAFKFARNAIESEGLQNIAIVSTDCAYERTRVAHMQLGILSDGAASCIVSGESDEAQFEILGEGQATNQKVLHLTWPDQKAAGLQFVVNGVRKAVEKAYHDAMLTRNDVDFLFCPNIRSDSNEFLSRFLRIERKRSYHEGLATYSHVYSSDCLINLVHSKLWRSKNSQNDGQTLLCLMMGSHSWGAMILRSK